MSDKSLAQAGGYDSSHELSLAQAKWDALTNFTQIGEMGKGGAELQGSEQGPGLRASKLAAAANVRFFDIGFLRKENKRLQRYADLVDGLAEGVIPDAKANKLLRQIWNDNRDALATGGFLSPDAVANIHRKIELGFYDEDVDNGAPSQWEAQVDELI